MKTELSSYGSPMCSKHDAKSFNEVNKFRKSIGMEPIKRVIRKCLKCDREFESHGLNHRMCGCVGEDRGML